MSLSRSPRTATSTWQPDSLKLFSEWPPKISTVPDGVVGATAQRQLKSKIAWATPIKKYVDQCCGSEHNMILSQWIY